MVSILPLSHCAPTSEACTNDLLSSCQAFYHWAIAPPLLRLALMTSWVHGKHSTTEPSTSRLLQHNNCAPPLRLALTTFVVQLEQSTTELLRPTSDTCTNDLLSSCLTFNHWAIAPPPLRLVLTTFWVQVKHSLFVWFDSLRPINNFSAI